VVTVLVGIRHSDIHCEIIAIFPTLC